MVKALTQDYQQVAAYYKTAVDLGNNAGKKNLNALYIQGKLTQQ